VAAILVWFGPCGWRSIKTRQAGLPPSQVSGRHLGLVWSELVNAMSETEGQPTFHKFSGDLNAIIGLVPEDYSSTFQSSFYYFFLFAQLFLGKIFYSW
jgi:hypothetical protein